MSTSAPRLRRLDDLRAVAAVLVFTCHVLREWFRHDPSAVLAPQLQDLGRFGVAIFFVISGLVIYRPFVAARRSGRPVELRAYAVRRAARIVPAYWLALCVFALLLPAEVPGVRSGEWPSFFGFAQIYTGTHDSGLAVAWTLCIEMSFYVAAPLLALALARLRGRHADRLELFLLAALTLATVPIRQDPTLVASSTIAGYFGWFAAGMVLARLSLSRPRRLPARELWLTATLGYLLLCIVVNGEPGTATGATAIIEYVGYAVLAALVVAPAIGSAPGGGRLGWLGDRSYGIYLWHLPIAASLASASSDPVLYAASCAGLTLLAAHLSYVLVERPLMRATRLRSASPAAAAPHAASSPAAT